jgi:hypothetical protein
VRVAQLRTPAPLADDDTVLIPVVASKRRSVGGLLALIGGALLGLVAVAGIVVSVLTVSDESDRPVIKQAPLTPISAPPHTSTPIASTVPSDQPVEPTESFPPLPPVTATAQTLAPQPVGPADGGPIRERLHQLFPRLFPENP